MSFPRYPEYKASGVEWLGDVPGHWEVKKLKYVCSNMPSNVDKKSVDGQSLVKLCNYTDVYYNDYISFDLEFMQATATDDQIHKFGLLADDVLITKDSETPDDIAKSAYVRNDMPGVICGYHLAMIRPNQKVILGLFIKRLFDSIFIRSKVATLANGLTRHGLSHAAIDCLELPVPPKHEQQAIADFLDRETAKIDGLIEEQRRLVELLKEKRQAVISHAVTKGLNPNAPMKPSGIEWLGDIPEHWLVGKCGFYISILSGYAFPSVGFSHNETHTRLLRGINVGVSEIKWNDTVYWERATVDGLDEYILKDGDLVIGMDRPLISEGIRVAKISDKDLPALLLQRVASIKCDNRMLIDFLYHFLSSPIFVGYFEPETTGVSIPHISPTQIEHFAISVPTIDEQLQIVKHIELEYIKINGLISETEKSIVLLQERRTALISAAVTGKIDVRGLIQAESKS